MSVETKFQKVHMCTTCGKVFKDAAGTTALTELNTDGCFNGLTPKKNNPTTGICFTKDAFNAGIVSKIVKIETGEEILIVPNAECLHDTEGAIVEVYLKYEIGEEDKPETPINPDAGTPSEPTTPPTDPEKGNEPEKKEMVKAEAKKPTFVNTARPYNVRYSVSRDNRTSMGKREIINLGEMIQRFINTRGNCYIVLLDKAVLPSVTAIIDKPVVVNGVTISQDTKAKFCEMIVDATNWWANQ